jgi:hypothetical protein
MSEENKKDDKKNEDKKDECFNLNEVMPEKEKDFPRPEKIVD